MTNPTTIRTIHFDGGTPRSIGTPRVWQQVWVQTLQGRENLNGAFATEPSAVVNTLRGVTVDWSFARRPFWLFSHVFAASVVVSFVVLGFWQFNRHGERGESNELIEARSQPPAEALQAALERPVDELDYRYVTGVVTYLDEEVVRVANRSQGGVAGSHIVALAELSDGQQLLVNRGFIPLDSSVEIQGVPTGAVEISGWLRASVERGSIGATDTGEGDLVPRLDVVAIDGRVEGSLVAAWLQLAPPERLNGATFSVFPDPVPLPSIDGGPHLSYMVQWFVFAALGAAFYVALLRRTSRARPLIESPSPV